MSVTTQASQLAFTCDFCNSYSVADPQKRFATYTLYLGGIPPPGGKAPSVVLQGWPLCWGQQDIFLPGRNTSSKTNEGWFDNREYNSVTGVIYSAPDWDFDSEEDKDPAGSGRDRRGKREIGLGISQRLRPEARAGIWQGRPHCVRSQTRQENHLNTTFHVIKLTLASEAVFPPSPAVFTGFSIQYVKAATANSCYWTSC